MARTAYRQKVLARDMAQQPDVSVFLSLVNGEHEDKALTELLRPIAADVVEHNRRGVAPSGEGAPYERLAEAQEHALRLGAAGDPTFLLIRMSGLVLRYFSDRTGGYEGWRVLQRCQNELCARYFIAGDDRQVYCAPGCRESRQFHNVASRVRRHRVSKRND